MSASSFTMNGERFIILREKEYRRLREKREAGKRGDGDEWGLPPLPDKLPDGNYPAVEYARALTGRDLIRSRRRLGWTQRELSRRSGVRVEVLNRIERGKLTGTAATMEKLDAALNGATAKEG